MPTGRLADNINDTVNAGELITKLVAYPPHAKIMVSITGSTELVRVQDSVHYTVMEPLICALEIEDIHYMDDGVIVLAVGHEVIDRGFEAGLFD